MFATVVKNVMAASCSGIYMMQSMFRKDSESVRIESCQGFAISYDELKRIDAIISPLD